MIRELVINFSRMHPPSKRSFIGCTKKYFGAICNNLSVVPLPGATIPLRSRTDIQVKPANYVSIDTFAKILELLFRVYGIMLDQDAVHDFS